MGDMILEVSGTSVFGEVKGQTCTRDGNLMKVSGQLDLTCFRPLKLDMDLFVGRLDDQLVGRRLCLLVLLYRMHFSQKVNTRERPFVV